MLDDILVSEVRVKILKIFLSYKAPEFLHIREITRQVGTEINAVRRELERLTKVGFLKREPRGNRVYFKLKREFPLYGDLLSFVAKETGLGKALLDSINSLGNVKLIIISKLFYLGRISKPTEVDLFILGKVDMGLITKILKEEEKRVGQEINYTIMADDEFEFRKKRKDTFLTNILLEPRIVIFGNEEKYTKLSI